MGNWFSGPTTQTTPLLNALVHALIADADPDVYHTVYVWKDNGARPWATLRVLVENETMYIYFGHLTRDKDTQILSFTKFGSGPMDCSAVENRLVCHAHNAKYTIDMKLELTSSGILGEACLRASHAMGTYVPIRVGHRR